MSGYSGDEDYWPLLRWAAFIEAFWNDFDKTAALLELSYSADASHFRKWRVFGLDGYASGTPAPTAPRAFDVGQAMHASGAEYVDGVTAVYAAGHFDEAVAMIITLASKGFSEDALSLFFHLPMLFARSEESERANRPWSDLSDVEQELRWYEAQSVIDEFVPLISPVGRAPRMREIWRDALALLDKTQERASYATIRDAARDATAGATDSTVTQVMRAEQLRRYGAALLSLRPHRPKDAYVHYVFERKLWRQLEPWATLLDPKAFAKARRGLAWYLRAPGSRREKEAERWLLHLRARARVRRAFKKANPIAEKALRDRIDY